MLVSRFPFTLFLKHSIFHQKEGLEHGSFFEDRFGMRWHRSWRDTTDVRIMPTAGYKEYRSILSTVKYLYTTTADRKSLGSVPPWRTNHELDIKGTHDPVVEHWPVTGKSSLSYARAVADGWPFMWVNIPLQGQPTRPTQPFIFSGR